MTRTARIFVAGCGFVLALGILADAQSARPAVPSTPARRVQRPVKPGPARALTAAEIRRRFLAFLDRADADQSFDFSGRKLGPRELRTELQKPEYLGRAARRLDIVALQRQVAQQHASKVAAANQHAAAVAKALGRTLTAGKVAANQDVTGVLAGPPRIDAIEDRQVSYSPGMQIVIRGSGFHAYDSAYGPQAPGVMIRSLGRKGSSRVVTLKVVSNPSGETSTERLLVATLPADLEGLMDQTVQLYVETHPVGESPRKSNEVPVPFKARRELKVVERDRVTTSFCTGITMVCDRSDWGTPGNMQACRDWGLFEGNLAYDGYYPGRQAALDKTRGYAISTLHESRCKSNYGDSAPGFDVYEIPLYNAHEFEGTSLVYGGGLVAPAVMTGPNKVAVHAWFVSDGVLYYGLNVAIVGPAGVPYHEPW